MVTEPVTSPTATAEKVTSAVAVRLFAGAADIVGMRTILLDAEDPLTIREAFLRLCHVFPALGALEGRLLFAANTEYAGPEFVLHAGDELALIPPVSGGSSS